MNAAAADLSPMIEVSSEAAGSAASLDGRLLVVLPVLPQAEFEAVLDALASSMSTDDLLIAAPDGCAPESHAAFRFVTFAAPAPSWTLTAADFVNAYQLAEKNSARALLMLGPGCASLNAFGLRDLANPVFAGATDLAVPCYTLPPLAGLVNSSILYPLSRALFASRARYPLAIDLGLSLRMAQRLAGVAARFVALNQSDAPLWAVSEATVAGMNIEEVDVGPRALPQPAEPDLHSILPSVTGSLFSDIDAKAAFWQRVRITPPGRRVPPATHLPEPEIAAETETMLQGFRLAYSNLREIWALVLPPNSLLGLKRLSQIEGTAFRMPDTLWTRIVFDFLIAYHMRTLNRSHLLGALIPLYLAWVASHINLIATGTSPERHIEALATAFEADKAYLVARWRWPDRFNP
ncbi:MAG TPA: hypothetical protein VE291_12545 [Terracidiphilus sp.]|jgi:hypothetical protein|nr:hypothetical protein [Terracidiphilus sp.]